MFLYIQEVHFISRMWCELIGEILGLVLSKFSLTGYSYSNSPIRDLRNFFFDEIYPISSSYIIAKINQNGLMFSHIKFKNL